jgi:hypothetical protein
MNDRADDEESDESACPNLVALTKHLAQYRRIAEKLRDQPRHASEYVEKLQRMTQRQEQLIRAAGEDLFQWLQEGGSIEFLDDDGEVAETLAVDGKEVDLEESWSDLSESAPTDESAEETEDEGSAPDDSPPSWYESSIREPEERQQAAQERFQEICSSLGDPPEALDSMADVADEVNLLRETVDSRDDWSRFHEEHQRVLIAYIVARARRVQDEVAASLKFDSVQEQLGDVFRMMTKYSKIEQPGFVHGLARNHDPKGGTWLDDAQSLWTDDLG